MMKRPRILFVGQFPPPIHGVSVINKWIVESEVLRDRFDFDVLDIATAKEIRDIGRASCGKYLKSLLRYGQLVIKLIFSRPSAIYVTLSPIGGPFFKDSIFLVIARIFRVRRVIHIHGKGIKNYLLKHARYKGYYNFVFRNASVIHLADSLLKDLDPISSYRSLHVLHNGIPDLFIEEKRKTSLHVLYISNLIETKGGLDLLRAFTQIRTQFPGVVVTFVGDWGDEVFKDTFLKFIKDNELSDSVRLPGTLQGKEKYDMLASADLFVMPTFYPNECFPLTILEAMSFGLPVISTYEGAIPDIIKHGETGFLVESRNAEMLAAKMSDMLASTENIRKMGENARKEYLQKYTFSIFERNFDALLQQALSND